MIRPVSRQGPPLKVVAPFFLASPLGLALAGAMVMRTDGDSLLVVNTPQLVAATHAAVLGWLALTIMGAIYQLGPAVFGGRLLSPRLARVQFVLHAASVAGFVVAAQAWHVVGMIIAGVGMATSLVLFLTNAIPAVRWFRKGSLPRLYLSAALTFLAGAAAVGVTYVGSLEHAWFPVTQGRVAGHAHLGLAGWLGLTVMGVSYQLVPMFQVAPHRPPRFGKPALVIMASTAGVGSLVLMTDPPVIARVAVALALATGPLLWMADIVTMLRTRARRVVDIHTRSTVASLGFLVVVVLLGVASAIGEPVSPGGGPARLQLAYGVAAVGGWAGITLIGNSFKIVPFLVWNARYRELAGAGPVPLVTELSAPSWAHATLILHVLAVTLLVAAALAGQMALLHAGGLLLVAAGVTHFAVLLFIVTHDPTASRRIPAMPRRATL